MAFFHEFVESGLHILSLDYVYLWVILFAFSTLWPSKKRFDKTPGLQKSPYNLIGYYYFFTVVFLYLTVESALKESNFLLKIDPDASQSAKMLTTITVAYVAGYGYSLYRLIFYQPNALILTKIFLLTLPLVRSALPCIASTVADPTGNVDIYSTIDFEDMTLEYLIWPVPWFLYFSFSQSLRSSWKTITEYKQKQDADRNIPIVS